MLDKLNPKTKLNCILFILSIFLLILYFLSFSKLNSNQTNIDKRKSIKTAIINSKNIQKINKIEITQGQENLVLLKIESNWFVQNNIPCQILKIETMLDDLSKTREIYKRSEKITDKTDFGFNDEKTVHFKYFLDDGNYKEVLFGKYDFSKTSRYMISTGTTSVYEIDSSVDIYLSTLLQNWAEPFIISQELIGNIKSTDIQKITITKDSDYKKVLNSKSDNYSEITSKLLILRHGGSGNINLDSSEFLYQFNYELGNKNYIIQSVYPSVYVNDNEVIEYVLLTEYYDDKLNKKYNVSYKISAWTYNTISKLLDL